MAWVFIFGQVDDHIRLGGGVDQVELTADLPFGIGGQMMAKALIKRHAALLHAAGVVNA